MAYQRFDHPRIMVEPHLVITDIRYPAERWGIAATLNI
jgi:hypothetical protein